MKKTFILAVAALFSTAAFAQTAAPAGLIELDGDQASAITLGMTIDQLEDMDIFDAQGTKLADVEEVLGTDANTPSAVAIELEGSDDIDVVLDLSALQLADNRLVTNLSVEELRALPTWND